MHTPSLFLVRMPRIIPRLLDRLSSLPDSARNVIVPNRPGRQKTMFRTPLEAPAFHPSKRSRSILMDEANPILHAGQFARHKRQPARVKLAKKTLTNNTVDSLREMTEQERRWWSDPYMRMLSSPLRKCLVTETYLPADFLIRLSVLKVPGQVLNISTPPISVVVPDGLEHTKFRSRKSGRAFYVSCRRETLTRLMDKGIYQRFAPRLTMSPGVIMQVANLLRVRVLQEIQLIADTLSAVKYKAEIPILRRLTREELKNIRETGYVQQPHALAILLVPPVNNNATTGLRTQPSMSTLPSLASENKKTLPPLSLMLSCEDKHDVADELLRFPTPQVPLYNGLSLFPDSSQRAAFHSILTSILSKQPKVKIPDASKASHAFLLCSSAETVQMVDVAPLAIAMWRLRMFEGQGEKKAD